MFAQLIPTLQALQPIFAVHYEVGSVIMFGDCGGARQRLQSPGGLLAALAVAGDGHDWRTFGLHGDRSA